MVVVQGYHEVCVSLVACGLIWAAHQLWVNVHWGMLGHLVVAAEHSCVQRHASVVLKLCRASPTHSSMLNKS
jgi:hypothetical protein